MHDINLPALAALFRFLSEPNESKRNHIPKLAILQHATPQKPYFQTNSQPIYILWIVQGKQPFYIKIPLIKPRMKLKKYE